MVRLSQSGCTRRIVVVGILTTLPGFAQPKATLALLDKSKPSVYITYVRSAPRTPLHTDESNSGVWMRVHNNTSSPLLVPGFEVPKTTGDTGFVYEVRLIPGSEISSPPVGEHRKHMQSLVTIDPGKSLEFSVPTEHLARGLEIAVPFNYQWENQALVLLGKEAEHWVVFRLQDHGSK